MAEHRAEYILPLRRQADAGRQELVDYVRWLSGRVDVTIVDGSDAQLFDALAHDLPAAVQHVVPRHPGLNGKARGVLTGVDLARHEAIVLADDDVRYDEGSLTALLERLEQAHFVRPQNVYSSYPWHAQWDTSRMLLARAFGGDFGGTVGLRRSAMRAAGGYSADVLFENLELERTIRCAGGAVDVARDLYVLRRPPTVGHFLGQRVRQAYDSFAQPLRLAAELLILPVLAIGIATRAWKATGALAVCAIAVAEVGRRTDGASRRIPARTILWTPLWLLERGISAWLAVLARLRGGIGYAGARIVSAGTPLSALRQRAAGGSHE